MADNNNLCFGVTPFSHECKVLSGTVLCDGLKRNCPFFKTKADNDAELMKYNGTTSLKAIATAYAAGHPPKEVPEPKMTTKPTSWTDEENTLLLNLFAEGMKWEHIARIIGRTASACYKHWRRLQHEMEEAS